MRSTLVDTNVYTAFKRDEPAIVEAFRHFDFIGLNVTVLAELYAGFKGGKREKKNRMELEDFLNSPRVHFIGHNIETADFYAHIFHLLKEKGRPIPTNDIWIAASALQNGLSLFSSDQHFTYVDGLILINKWY